MPGVPLGELAENLNDQEETTEGEDSSKRNGERQFEFRVRSCLESGFDSPSVRTETRVSGDSCSRK
jgi:hypothetical protein